MVHPLRVVRHCHRRFPGSPTICTTSAIHTRLLPARTGQRERNVRRSHAWESREPGPGAVRVLPVLLLAFSGLVLALREREERLLTPCFAAIVVLHWLVVSGFRTGGAAPPMAPGS